MLSIKEPLNIHTSNILKGLTIFLTVCSKTKIISHSGVIDVILTSSAYKEEELNSLVLLGWEELTDYSWRYWLEKEESPWITLVGSNSTLEDKHEKNTQYKNEIKYYNDEYQIIEKMLYDS